MSKYIQNEHSVDNLLKEVLKDDLPSEIEFKMRRQLSGFKFGLQASGKLRGAKSLVLWKCLPTLAQWLVRHPLLQKQALAYLSAIMLAAGLVIHLGGYQSALADSISLLRISMSLSQHIRMAGSMDCAVKVPVNGGEAIYYQILWRRDAGSLRDFKAPPDSREIVWIIQGKITGVDPATVSRGQTAGPNSAMPDFVSAFLSPAELARKMSESWQLQPADSQHAPGRLVFVDRQDRTVIELCFDRRSNLPVSLTWKFPNVSGTGGPALTAEFSWNQPMAPGEKVSRPNSMR